MHAPDRRADDTLFANLFTSTGDRTALARLMDTSNSSVTQQLDPDNPDKSYYHAGKCALFASYTMDAVDGGTRGEALWRDLSEARERWIGRGAKEARIIPAPDPHAISKLCSSLIDQIILQGRSRAEDEDVRSAARKLKAALEAFLEGGPRVMQTVNGSALSGPFVS